MAPWLALVGLPAALRAQESPVLSGYVQARYALTSQDDAFSIRRAKAWVHGTTPFDEHWGYKVQAIFRSRLSGSLVLQDAFLQYRSGIWQVRFGQEVPDFSLQRHQPDWEIPVVERGLVINALIPSAESDARDIGVQGTVETMDRRLHASLGLFNGTGDNTFDTRDADFLVTGRVALATSLGGQVTGHVGTSGSLREADGIVFRRIYRDSTEFVGTDVRWGAELGLAHPDWEVQAEYIRADLEGQVAWGVYALADYRITARDLLIATFDKYRDLSPATDDDSWYGVGISHFISGERAKVMVEITAQFAEPATRYAGVAQLQIMFG